MSGTPSTNYAPCPYCGQGHTGTCHMIKAIEYRPDGSIKRVEFHETQPRIPTYVVGYNKDGTPLVKAGPGEMLAATAALADFDLNGGTPLDELHAELSVKN